MNSRLVVLSLAILTVHCGSAYEGSTTDAGSDVVVATDQRIVAVDRAVPPDQVLLDRPTTDGPAFLPDRVGLLDRPPVVVDATPDVRTRPDAVAFPDAPIPFRDVPVVSDSGRREDVTIMRDASGVSCTPQNALLTACSPITLPSEQGSFWDGDSCVLHGSNCEGPDCFSYRGPDALQNCKNAHYTCASQLCLLTGGNWDVVGRCGGAVRCGVYPAFDCAGPTRPLCNCGPGRTFDAVEGCVDDPTCGTPELCANTGGQWLTVGESCEPCDSCVGICPAVCAPVLEARCDCGPFATFDPALGCIPSDRCSPENKRNLCATQGGTWISPGCCDRVDACGHHAQPRCIFDDCAPEETCLCPRGLIWSGRGCIDSRCLPRLEGESCDEARACEGGLTCTYCGGPSGGTGSGDIIGVPVMGTSQCRYPACGFADNCLAIPRCERSDRRGNGFTDRAGAARRSNGRRASKRKLTGRVRRGDFAGSAYACHGSGGPVVAQGFGTSRHSLLAKRERFLEGAWHTTCCAGWR